MPGYLLTAAWVILFLLIIYRHRFFRIEGIHSEFACAAFLFKLILGFANYYIWLHVIGHGDSLRYMHDAQLVYSALSEQPGHFFQLLVGHSAKADVPEHLRYITENLYIEWHVSEYHMIRLLALLNVFSFGSAWGNIVILSFFVFSACMALFKVIARVYGPQKKARLVFFVIFFVPSIVFWSSGLLKEGVTLILLCILAVQMFSLNAFFSWKRIIITGVVLFFTWLIRDYVFLLTLFNLVIWTIISAGKKTSAKPLLPFTIITIFLFAVIIILSFYNEQFNIAAEIKGEQAYFLSTPPDPDYEFRALDGTYGDLVKKIPYAANNLLFRPNLLHSNDPFRIYQSVELVLVLIFFVLCLVRFRKQQPSPAAVFFLFLSIELLLVYGLMVTDADTLSRYRTIPLFFLLVLGVCHTRLPIKLEK